jgi:hypothetical protein
LLWQYGFHDESARILNQLCLATMCGGRLAS